MPLIVSPSRYKSKKAFKEAVAKDPNNVFVDDPSAFNPVSGSVAFVLEETGEFNVTNHPKRSWYSTVKIATGGKNKGKIVAI